MSEAVRVYALEYRVNDLLQLGFTHDSQKDEYFIMNAPEGWTKKYISYGQNYEYWILDTNGIPRAYVLGKRTWYEEKEFVGVLSIEEGKEKLEQLAKMEKEL
jgi:hypothetical protein